MSTAISTLREREATIELSFAAFYQESYGKVAAALRATLNDDDLGVEAADEAMTRCFARWHKVSHYENPAGWVYRVGLNWARSVQRKLGRRKLRQETPSLQPDTPDPAIAAALARLGVRHRTVVVCRILLDLSVEETASIMAIREGTVKSRLHRALGLLRTELSHLDPTTGEGS